jgi:hypothetical protein
MAVQKGDTNMSYVKKTFIGLLILITLNFYIPGTAFSREIILSARDNITTHTPESISTPEKDIPSAIEESPPKSGKGWLWAVVIIAAIAGGALAAGSGGGDGGGNNGGSSGSIIVGW